MKQHVIPLPLAAIAHILPVLPNPTGTLLFQASLLASFWLLQTLQLGSKLACYFCTGKLLRTTPASSPLQQCHSREIASVWLSNRCAIRDPPSKALLVMCSWRSPVLHQTWLYERTHQSWAFGSGWLCGVQYGCFGWLGLLSPESETKGTEQLERHGRTGTGSCLGPDGKKTWTITRAFLIPKWEQGACIWTCNAICCYAGVQDRINLNM